ncbi:MAG: hypothetical protein LKH74_04025 [Levilactobacillus sp.]|jgi:hypothetical protein|uniref:hypothetical protein n=1 Tax=Levilactobacillus sp. TaxID=2767919 RepID=UPI00258F172C|nr:hypothetical protein [Levilactobacillus sp.]MCI1553069.1 hypothetical protein [Levilactobacillus sp.]MCI1598210.1 hypothetical protein [Levilactobacillus sp.]MCI1605073.1 hypothetical protein [Levilactobacillus sp.]
MKFTNMMGALLATVSLGAALAVTTPTTDAQASTKTTMASFPKKFQGTWYYYQKGHYNRYTIKAKQTSFRNFSGKKWRTGYSPVKVTPLNKKTKNVKKYQGDTVLFMSKGWLMDHPWEYYSKGIKINDPGTEGYKIVTRHYRGKKIKSLFINRVWDASNGELHLQHYYKTKAQAKAFNPTGLIEDYPD